MKAFRAFGAVLLAVPLQKMALRAPCHRRRRRRKQSWKVISISILNIGKLVCTPEIGSKRFLRSGTFRCSGHSS
jgi:hypothetical protein